MDLSHIPALLADIGAEGRKLCGGHSHAYDVEVTYQDGTTRESNMGRFLPRRDEHMHRVCRWLATRPGNRVASIRLTPGDARGLSYIYVVGRGR